MTEKSLHNPCPTGQTFARVCLAALCVMLSCFAEEVCGDTPAVVAPVVTPTDAAATQNDANNIIDVRIDGNRQIDAKTIHKVIKTRKDRPFSSDLIEEDKRALMQKGWFIDVHPRVERTPSGYVVTFQFIERPIIHAVRFVGNSHHTKKKLQEESGLKAGDALDPIAIRQAKERLEAFYKDEGFTNIHIEILSGDRVGDRSAVFLVDEGETRGAFFYRVSKPRVLDVKFEGNTIASDGRLKTVIESKPGIFWYFVNGQFTREKLDSDVEKLTAYYRNLGFFYAKVDRLFDEGEGYTGMGKPNSWISVKFLIDEGPRCRLTDMRFIGNELFTEEQLYQDIKSSLGEYYDQVTIDADLKRIKEKYGVLGYVFADVKVEPRIDDDQVHLVLNVKEGPRCRAGDIQVEILGGEGSAPYTKLQTVLNRMSIKPGDVLSTREVDDSRRRLSYAGIFSTNPMEGTPPEITFEYPKQALRDDEERTTKMASPPPSDTNFRGQTPRSMQEAAANAKAAREAAALQPYSDFFRFRYTAPQQVAPQQVVPTNVAPVPTPMSHAPTSFAPTPVVAPTQVAPASFVQTSFAPPQVSAVYRGQQQQPANPFAPYGSIGGTSDVTAGQTRGPANLGVVPITGNTANSTYDSGPPRPLYDVPMKVRVQETRTGQVMMSVAVNSDAGLMGRFVLEEQNFDILRWPRSPFRLEDWRNSFRGAGQRFRLEAMPGVNVNRYEASWQTPYLFNLDYSLGLSGYYYQRGYDEWYEDRVGGTVTLGKNWTKDFSTALTFQGQEARIYHPQLPAYDLMTALGSHPLYTFGISATHDTRDNQYLATQGHRYTAGVEQTIGGYQYIRGSAEINHYLMLRERPDRSGRWVLGIRNAVGISESTTPIFERYFAGGFSSLRGFQYRTVSPRDFGPQTYTGMPVGGCFEFYNSAELIFPITADDMVRGSLFCDTGTVQTIGSKWNDPYRVSVGFGLRVTVPMMGPMPIALDFAFPLVKGPNDQNQLFTFNVGFMRM
ncbi:MAG: POTRA domain-containing protein [Thermoguttaceae bacterium]